MTEAAVDTSEDPTLNVDINDPNTWPSDVTDLDNPTSATRPVIFQFSPRNEFQLVDL